jgi:hypothetical protein
MLNKQVALVSLAIFLSIVINTSCSGSLSRSNASDLISKHEKFPETKQIDFKNVINVPNDGSEGGDFTLAMKSLGYVDSEGKLTQKGEDAKNNWGKKDIPLYPSGNYRIYQVTVGKREIVEVTGISDVQNPMGAFSEATFTWHWAAASDVGKAMNIDKKIYKGEALFQKFDDGWRIQKIHFEGDMF